MKWKNHVSHQAWIILVFVAFVELLFFNPAYADTPEMYSVEPALGRSDSELDIVITGSNFESGAKAALYGGGPFGASLASTPSAARNVFISGDFAYVAAGAGLQVIDISDFENATIVATCTLGGLTNDVFVSGGYAYVAAGSAGLKIVNIENVVSDPPEVLELTVAGSYDTPYSAEGIYISGNYAYVADGGSGLHIIDIANPAAPVKLDTYNTPGVAIGVSVYGDYAYVADRGAGLQILDVSNPDNVLYKGTYVTPGSAYRVAVKGNYAYVADYDGGLQVINITDPENPTLAGSSDKISYAQDVYVNGNYAYVAGSGADFTVVDISNPENPVLVNNCDTLDGHGIHISGKTAYMATYSGLSIIDINILDNPSIIGAYDALESATAVSVSGSYAYAVSYVSGLQVINITDPAHPSLVGSCPIPDASAHNIYVSGNYAYVADGANGLRIIDVANPAVPYIADTLDTPGTAYDVYVVGDYVYVADDDEGLHVVDIFNTAGPSIIGSVLSTQTTTNFRSVHVSGNYAYVLDYWTGTLYKITIVDPGSPYVSGWCVLSTYGNDVFVAGDYAYVAMGGAALEVINIAGSPTVVGSADTPYPAYGVYVEGDYAYVATGSGIQVVDVSSAANPLLVGACNTPGTAIDVHVTGSNVFAADGVMGLQVIEPFVQCTDVSFIDSETIIATIPMGFSAGGYNLHMVNPGGETDILYNGYMVSSTSPSIGPILFLLLSDN